MIHADSDQLHQVLLNLIVNAQQSLQDQPPPRRIRVTSRFDTATDMREGCGPRSAKARRLSRRRGTRRISSGRSRR